MKICPNCHNEIQDTAIRCIHCRVVFSKFLHSTEANRLDDRVSPPPWGLTDALTVYVYIALASIAIYLSLSLFFLFFRHPQEFDSESSIFVILYALGCDISICAIIYSSIKNKSKKSMIDLLNLRPMSRLSTLIIIILGITTCLATTFFRELIPPVELTESYKTFVSTPTGLTYLLIAGVTLAPIVEELLFRGFLYPAFEKHTGAFTAILITSTLFTLMHTQRKLTTDVFMMGMISSVTLTTIRAFTKSTFASMVAHLSYNMTVVFMAMVRITGRIM